MFYLKKFLCNDIYVINWIECYYNL